MSIQYKNQDFVIEFADVKARDIALKYEAFLDAITTDNFEHVRKAIRKSIEFLVSDKYQNTETMARENYQNNSKLKQKYKNLDEYLSHFHFLDKKSASIDLATGTGKSWVIYGIARIMLAEGLVDKVLVLCPSLTIENELKKKFDNLNANSAASDIISEIGGVHLSPQIKNANVPILDGDICVENIHAVYERTGSSVVDSFKGKGHHVLVISDEAHHIYSNADSDVKKWKAFLDDPEYGFYYHIGLSGTPYIKDEYFHDVICRYGIKQAIEDGVVKSIDYKIEEADTEKGFDETYYNHQEIKNKYLGKLKPTTIIVTGKIVTCVEVWNTLTKFISKKEDISLEKARRKVIWVTSGLPSNENEKAFVKGILSDPEKSRKENLALLKTVDDADNPVEWIVSVSMLTEGWDRII